ncbi:hypothetical protein [Halosolutus gelatinilyticus]|uniref:hypothetical protein n=1 Tax=Halosolutus gelatinilyticus TaxID=2931975 RepID=UPI001FF1C6BB|nr:hypothetical protein [Halosolutus gelatinilyticus]
MGSAPSLDLVIAPTSVDGGGGAGGFYSIRGFFGGVLRYSEDGFLERLTMK